MPTPDTLDPAPSHFLRTTDIQHRFDISGYPDLPVRYRTKTIRPTHAKVSLSDGVVQSVTFGGPWVLKSGATGEGRSDVTFYTSRRNRDELIDAPEWVAGFVTAALSEVQ